MMKSFKILLSLLGVLVVCAFTFGGGAGEKTFTGKLMCAQCELKETPKCVTAIRVIEGGKSVTYYLLDQGAAEDYHEAVCGSGQKAGKVTGVVSVKDGKRWITPKKVEYTEK
jgi:hypothetical protein